MLEKQMELFEEGGQVDPVSGNDVPLGSTEKEVRDDQPAMLSEGEMVVPADVVRYFGVEHFMKLRDEAKMGYKKMEAMGQFGTEEGQTLPDDALFNAGGPPFTVEDIEVIEPDDLENLEGGEEAEIEAANGALVRNFAEGGNMTTPNMTGGMSIPPSTAGTANTIPFGTTPLVPDTGREAKLSDSQGLGQLVGSTGVGAFSTKYFMDPTGTIHQIFTMEGLAQQEVPEDFIEIDSPFELRSYAELGGSVSKVAPTKEEEEEEFTDGDGATGEYGGDGTGDGTAADPDPSGSEGHAGGPGGQNEGSVDGPSPDVGGDEEHGGPSGQDGPGNDGGDSQDEGGLGIAKGGLIERKKRRGGRKKKKRGGLGSR